ncbi:phage tail tape measure protein [Mucisphaera calidilacus]|uniref:Phage tail tape measure protein n=1 Tax=Mucisphaera calidilacus TaxID=2527982 RepID=A0A518BVN1_9BACT|nr:hypothetical protein [Mucisphaera calidilacus]QDU71035.1 hypothetical protein Pan265_08800 [Mucisphaera calidilacus]
MASSRGIKAGRAFVELFADESKLVRGLRRAERRLAAFGDSVRGLGLRMTAIGVALLAPLAASVKLFGGYGDQVAKMARRTGLSVVALSELRYAASVSGTSLEALEVGLRRMQRSIYDAGRGLSTQTDALSDLGLAYRDLAGLPPEDQFSMLAQAISRIEDPTRKAALAQALLGRAGTQLLPLMAGGAKGIEKLQEEARRLGLTMSGKDARAAEVLTDALDRLWKVVKMGVFYVGAALAPALTKAADTITLLVVRVSAWVSSNRQLVVSVLKVALGVLAAGAAITVLGAAITAAAAGLGVLASVGAAVVTALATIGAAISALLSPVGLVTAGLAAFAGHLLYSSEAGGRALSWLSGKFAQLKEQALAAYRGIARAFAAGDMALAAKIMWLTIELAWTRGLYALKKAWMAFTGVFIKLGHDAFSGLLAVAQQTWHALEVGWIETTAMFSKAWQSFVAYFARSWQQIKAQAHKAWNWIRSLFDESIDLQVSNKLIEQRKQAAIRQISDQQQRAIAQREARRQAQVAQASATHQATMAVIGSANSSTHQQVDADYRARLARSEQELAQARLQWQEAIDAAKTSESGGPSDQSVTGNLRDALAGLGDIGELLHAEAARIGVRGTFNAEALRSLGSSDAEDRTADAAEATAKNTGKLVEAARSGGLRFG